jgi:peptidylprolyl isomerase
VAVAKLPQLANEPRLPNRGHKLTANPMEILVMSTAAKHGDTVTVHYTGKLPDGSVFDTSKGREPIQFVVGQRKVIPGFEIAVTGMSPGETKTVNVAPEEGYGPHQSQLVVTFPRDEVPAEYSVKVGQTLQVQTTSGETLPATVVELSDTVITLDANHPLAGQELTFDIQLVELVAEA